jgi:hypothetical protein
VEEEGELGVRAKWKAKIDPHSPSTSLKDIGRNREERLDKSVQPHARCGQRHVQGLGEISLLLGARGLGRLLPVPCK